MIYKYVADENLELTTMLIHGCIGLDELGNGIDGATFANELYDLQNKGVQRVIIGINSPGGSVIDAGSIFAAIANTTMPVDTRIDFAAWSAAGYIAMAGKKRYTMPNGLLMLHQVSGGGDSPADILARGKMSESILQIFNSNTKVDKDILTGMMECETWLDAEEMLAFGFVDKILPSTRQLNIPVETVKENRMAAYEFVNSVLKSETPTNKDYEEFENTISALKKELEIVKTIIESNKKQYENMTNGQLAKALGLPADATDDDILAEIKELKGNAKENSKAEEMKKDKEKAEKEAADAKKNLVDTLANVTDTLIEDALNSGKIKFKDEADKTAQVARLKNIFSNSFEGGKMVLDSLETPKNVSRAVNYKNIIGGNPEGSQPEIFLNTQLTDVEKKYTHRDWERNNAVKLAEIYANDPDFAAELYNKSYSK